KLFDFVDGCQNEAIAGSTVKHLQELRLLIGFDVKDRHPRISRGWDTKHVEQWITRLEQDLVIACHIDQPMVGRHDNAHTFAADRLSQCLELRIDAYH